MSDETLELLIARVAILERQMLGVLVTLDPSADIRRSRTDPDTGEVRGNHGNYVPRGKYTGRTHDAVVTLDPAHVVWLFDNDKASGLGYTAVHGDKARELAKTLLSQAGKKGSHR